MPEGQPNASTQYEDWKEFPKSCREPTHEEWLEEVNVLKSCRDHWKNSYYATHKIIGKILDFYSLWKGVNQGWNQIMRTRRNRDAWKLIKEIVELRNSNI